MYITPNRARSPDFSDTNHQSPNKKKKKNSLITKILMYYESFHAALWSFREIVSRARYVTNHAIFTGSHNDARIMYVLPLNSGVTNCHETTVDVTKWPWQNDRQPVLLVADPSFFIYPRKYTVKGRQVRQYRVDSHLRMHVPVFSTLVAVQTVVMVVRACTTVCMYVSLCVGDNREFKYIKYNNAILILT